VIKNSTIFELDGWPGLIKSLPMALQHLVAMIVGCVTPALIISQTAGLSPSDSVILVQSALIGAGISTLIQLFPLFRRLGSGLPVIMGVSFAYLSSMQSITADFGLAAVFGAQIAGGFIAVLVGLAVRKIRFLFPPLITGTVVFTIGLSLYPTAINYMAGGVGSPTFGAWQNWAIAFATLAVVTILNHYGNGMLKLASILSGIIFGYVLALLFGMVDFTPVAEASFLQMPKIGYFGIRFELSSCLALGLLFAINSIQAIGDFTATTVGGLSRQPEDEELQGGIVGYGISNMINAVLGGLPTATYSQNVGIVSTTKVVNRMTLSLTAGMLLLSGFVPKISALLTTIPQCVLGGATVSVFASIAMTGMKLVVSEPMNYRNSSIVGLSAALGMGFSQSAAVLSTLPDWFVMIFARSPVVIATIVAVLLNILLPNKEDRLM
jgi:uracil-xanthine permease